MVLIPVIWRCSQRSK